MTADRIHNFNAGPSALPLSVLEKIQASFLNFNGSGMSITEISHRSDYFDAVINDAVARTKRLLNLDDRFEVFFVQGGASMQFAMIPMNFLGPDESADYIDTGIWSSKAIEQARLQGKDIRVAGTSEDRNFSYVPMEMDFDPRSKFVHITSNNTIKGTQYHEFPDTKGIPFIADMSSDILSRKLDMDRFGLIYAGAQKNLGPSGCVMIIANKEFLARHNENIPTMFDYSVYAAKNSMYNTPPCFGIYTVSLVLQWLEEEMGGLAAIEAHNRKKAGLFYDFMDSSDFYRGTAEKASRSLMNIAFRLPTEALEEKFVQQATQAGFGGLKGHRSVGGCRASIYNAARLESVEALLEFMESFAKENG
ncbi:MAG: 3-phosphoserine/phosphohydroxythreonine transaminase [Desulfobacterales bacterium]|nr:3-phosphoserine/phosphohydroxythreonine transaminase [Desulfobacterales bacterium]